jgi:hypothetical protein
MKSRYTVQNRSVNKVLKLTIIILFIISSIFTLSNLFFINNTKASENTSEWQVTLNITGSDGTKDTVVFGEKIDASDGKDQEDLPKPPDPPIPFIRASFITNLEAPYNTLWEDYRALSEDSKTWNLTIIWVSDNNSTTNLTISWETSEVLASGYDSVYLHNAKIIDMKTNSNYQYTSSNSEPQSFQIILQNKELNGASDTNNITSILLIALIIVIIIIIIIAVYIKKRK